MNWNYVSQWQVPPVSSIVIILCIPYQSLSMWGKRSEEGDYFSSSLMCSTGILELGASVSVFPRIAGVVLLYSVWAPTYHEPGSLVTEGLLLWIQVAPLSAFVSHKCYSLTRKQSEKKRGGPEWVNVREYQGRCCRSGPHQLNLIEFPSISFLFLLCLSLEIWVNERKDFWIKK